MIYVNGVLHFDKYLDGKLENMDSSKPSLIRQNKGNLYVAPKITSSMDISTTTIDKLLMADLTYYNYALSKEEIASLYSSGFTKKVAAAFGDSAQSRSQLDEITNNISSPSGGNTMNIKSDLYTF